MLSSLFVLKLLLLANSVRKQMTLLLQVRWKFLSDGGKSGLLVMSN